MSMPSLRSAVDDAVAVVVVVVAGPVGRSRVVAVASIREKGVVAHADLELPRRSVSGVVVAVTTLETIHHECRVRRTDAGRLLAETVPIVVEVVRGPVGEGAPVRSGRERRGAAALIIEDVALGDTVGAVVPVRTVGVGRALAAGGRLRARTRVDPLAALADLGLRPGDPTVDRLGEAVLADVVVLAHAPATPAAGGAGPLARPVAVESTAVVELGRAIDALAVGLAHAGEGVAGVARIALVGEAVQVAVDAVGAEHLGRVGVLVGVLILVDDATRRVGVTVEAVVRVIRDPGRLALRVAVSEELVGSARDRVELLGRVAHRGDTGTLVAELADRVAHHALAGVAVARRAVVVAAEAAGRRRRGVGAGALGAGAGRGVGREDVPGALGDRRVVAGHVRAGVAVARRAVVVAAEAAGRRRRGVGAGALGAGAGRGVGREDVPGALGDRRVVAGHVRAGVAPLVDDGVAVVVDAVAHLGRVRVDAERARRVVRIGAVDVAVEADRFVILDDEVTVAHALEGLAERLRALLLEALALGDPAVLLDDDTDVAAGESDVGDAITVQVEITCHHENLGGGDDRLAGRSRGLLEVATGDRGEQDEREALGVGTNHHGVNLLRLPCDVNDLSLSVCLLNDRTASLIFHNLLIDRNP